MSMGTYSANNPLLGEKKMELKVGEEPHVFWRKLLEGRNPQWRNLSIATPRNRKRVQYFDKSPDPPNGNDDIGKKRRKAVMNHSVDANPTHPTAEGGEVAAFKGGVHENDGIGAKHVSRSPSHVLHEVNLVGRPEGGVIQQKSLHIHLKAEFAKLFEALKLPDDVKHTVEKFLEYVMENHHVSRESATILQAFQLSLCWVAASILKQKIDKEETFLLAKQHLQFGCTEEEVNGVYLKIRSLKKMFLQRLDQNDNASSSSKSSLLAARSVPEEPSKGSMSQAVESSQLNVENEMVEGFKVKNLSMECIVTPKEELVDIEREKFIKEVQYRCDRRMSKLVQKQKEEIKEFQKIWEKKKEELELDYRVNFSVIRSIFGQNAAIKDKQKILETEFSSKIQKLKCLKDQQLKELEVEHTAMRYKEMQKAASWLAEANSFRGVGSNPIDDIGCSQENVNVSHNRPKTVHPVSGQHVEELNGNIVDRTQCDRVASELPTSTSDESNILPIETTDVLATPATEEQVEIASMARVLVARLEQPNEIGDLGGGSEEIGAFGATSNQPNEVGDPDVPASTSNESNILPVETSNVLTTAAMEEQVEIASTAEALVARSKQPNEVVYSGGISEEIGALVATSKEPNEVGDLGGSSEKIGALVAASKHPNEVGDPDVPSSTSNESNIRPIGNTNVLAAPAAEEQVEIASTAGALVARYEKPNEVGGGSEKIASVFPLLSEEHTEVPLGNPTREHMLEVSGTGVNVVVENDHSEVNNVIEELNTEHGSLENNSHLPNDEENSRDAVSSTDRNQISLEEVVVDLRLAAAVPTSDGGGSIPQNQSSGYNETLTHEMPLQENQSGTQADVDAGQCGPNSSEAVLINSSERQQPASDGFSLAAHEPPSGTARQTHDDKRNFIPNIGSSRHLDGEMMETLQAGGNSGECPSVDVEMSPLSCDRPNLSEISRVDPRPISEQGASSKRSEASVQVPGSAELPSQAVLQHNTNVAFVQGPRNIPVHPAHQMAAGNPILPFNADPLHKEWERIHKEREQATKILEDTKLRLRSDCEKAIEELVAQIRKKYDLNLQETEAAFLRKKNELDTSLNKVLMNKLLADAFRCKCMNLKPSGLPGIRQVVPSSYMQHLHQVSQQPNLRSSPVTGSSAANQQNLAPGILRASHATSLSSAGQAQVGQEPSVPSLPVINRSVNSGGIPQPAFRSTPVTGLSLAGQQAPIQQTAAVSRSPAFTAGIPGRPPLISAITPSTGNLRVAGEIRAPAPHLQPFRTPTSMSTSSPSTLAHGLQNQPLSTNMAASSPSLPQLASLQTTSSPSQLATDLSTVVDLSASRSMNSQHDIGRLPAPRNPPMSARELLLNMENRPHANRRNIMPPLPDMSSNFDSLDLSDFQTLDSVQGGSTSSAIATNVTDVVCVSDDE